MVIIREWHHGQYMVNHFQKVIELAAKYKLNIITHEPIKDTGLRRKYPNYISREGLKDKSSMASGLMELIMLLIYLLQECLVVQWIIHQVFFS